MSQTVQCKNCVNLKDDWCALIADSPYEELERICGSFKQKTNADKIRDMTPERMAELFSEVETEGRAYGIKGKNAWLNWLQKEVES